MTATRSTRSTPPRSPARSRSAGTRPGCPTASWSSPSRRVSPRRPTTSPGSPVGRPCRGRRSSCCSTTAGGEASRSSCRSTTIASSRVATSPRASSRPCTATSSRPSPRSLRADEGFVEALRRRGIDDPAVVHVEPWSSRHVRARSGPASARDRLGAARRQRRQPLLAPAVRPRRRGRSQRDDRAPHRRPRPRDTAAERRRRRLPRRRRSALPGRPAAHLDHAAGGAELRARRPSRRLAEMGSARRVPSPRGSHASRHRLHGRRGAALDLPPRLDRGARHPLRRSRTRRPTSRTCSTSASTGSAPLTNSLTLGCDCLGEIRYLDARHEHLDGRAADDPERDLHPRGGRRHPLEAHGRRTRAVSTGRGRAASSSRPS